LLTIKALNQNQEFLMGRLMRGAHAATCRLPAAPALPGRLVMPFVTAVGPVRIVGERGLY
jgi:hypothetical protein